MALDAECAVALVILEPLVKDNGCDPAGRGRHNLWEAVARVAEVGGGEGGGEGGGGDGGGGEGGGGEGWWWGGRRHLEPNLGQDGAMALEDEIRERVEEAPHARSLACVVDGLLQVEPRLVRSFSGV